MREIINGFFYATLIGTIFGLLFGYCHEASAEDIEVYIVTQRECPFIVEAEGELEWFKADCETQETEDGILIPPNCKYTFLVEGKSPGGFIIPFCPTILVKHKLGRAV